MSSKVTSTIIIVLFLAAIAGAGIFRVLSGIRSSMQGSPPDSGTELTARVGGERSEKDRQTAPNTVSIPEPLREHLPRSFRIVYREKPFLHWELVDRDGNPEYIVLESASVVPHAGRDISYSGSSVNVGIIFSAEGRVHSCVLISSRDTNEFISLVKKRGFFSRVEGKGTEDLTSVDTVSGATQTSGSILDAVIKTSAVIEQYLDELKEGGFSQDVGAEPARKDRPTGPDAQIQAERMRPITETAARQKNLSLREARYYTQLPDQRVRCRLCPFRCVLAPGERGQCRVRANIDGTLRTLVYGRILASHVDPIEKKPLYHFIPSSKAYSVATAGCNLRCIFCQNYSLSQAYPEDVREPYRAPGGHYRQSPAQVLSPEQTVEQAVRKGCSTIAYTYSEPSVFFEYMLHTARLAKKRGLCNVWITCGYLNTEPLQELCRYIDGANVDLKGFSEEYYRKYCGAHLSAVLNTLKTLKQQNVYFEITNLVVPGGNDDPEMIRNMCSWIVKNLGKDVPLHFSRFYPQYKMSGAQPTPESTLISAARTAREEGLQYVYLGNMRTGEGEDTFCPECGKKIIDRWGYYIKSIHIQNGCCSFCGNTIHGIWK